MFGHFVEIPKAKWPKKQKRKIGPNPFLRFDQLEKESRHRHFARFFVFLSFQFFCANQNKVQILLDIFVPLQMENSMACQRALWIREVESYFFLNKNSTLRTIKRATYQLMKIILPSLNNSWSIFQLSMKTSNSGLRSIGYVTGPYNK